MLNKYKLTKYMVYSSIIYVVISIISLISPYIMGLIIDVYIPNRSINGLIFGTILFVLLPFFSVGLSLLYNYVMIKIVRNKGNELSIDIMSKLVYQNYSYFDDENSLELLSYVSKEIVRYLNFYIIELPKYYINILICLIIVIFVSFMNPIIGALQILYLPLTLLPMKKIMHSTENEISIVVENNAKMNQIKGDIFKSIEFIKTANLEDKKLNQVRKANNNINKIWGKVAALDTLTGIWSSGFMTLLFTGLTFAVGAIFIFNDFMGFTLGNLVSVVSYAGLLYNKVNIILNTKISKKKEDANFKEAISYLSLKDERDVNKGLLDFKFKHEIKLENLSFRYTDEKTILHNINITIPYNKWTSIVGQTGSGKSTIFNLMLKLYNPNKNELFVDGVDIVGINSFSIRNNIIKISQNITLFPGSILDNMKLINENISLEDIDKVLEIACLDKFVKSLPKGIDTDIGEMGKLISGGEKQRLSLAIGLLRKGKTLLLDEITSNLDLETTKYIELNLKKLLDYGYTIISISHDQNFIDVSDVIYEIKDGQAIRLK